MRGAAVLALLLAGLAGCGGEGRGAPAPNVTVLRALGVPLAVGLAAAALLHAGPPRRQDLRC